MGCACKKSSNGGTRPQVTKKPKTLRKPIVITKRRG